jgi:galactose mutarotase-like enzyme
MHPAQRSRANHDRQHGTTPFPFGLGFHPFFPRTTATELAIRCGCRLGDRRHAAADVEDRDPREMAVRSAARSRFRRARQRVHRLAR